MLDILQAKSVILQKYIYIYFLKFQINLYNNN